MVRPFSFAVLIGLSIFGTRSFAAHMCIAEGSMATFMSSLSMSLVKSNTRCSPGLHVDLSTGAFKCKLIETIILRLQ